MNGAPKKKKTPSVASSADGRKYGLSVFQVSLWNLTGFCVCLFCGGLYVYIASQIHDARQYFTGITEIEREISFRTENGLYYSYYKHLVKSPSFLQGINDLMNERLTEHPSTINVLSRMNVYQEVVLAAAYRFCPFIATTFEPIFFYVYYIFLLHGLLTIAIFLLSWSLSGTWLSGLLSFILYIYHWNEVTRVENYMPLRENFALPALWIQLLLIHYYFKQDFNPKFKLPVQAGISLCSFLFAITWQFNQFAFLLQAAALVACQGLGLVQRDKLSHVMKSLLISILLVCLLQFINTMILSGFLVCLLVSALLLFKLQDKFPYDHTKSSLTHIIFIVSNIIFVVIFTIIIHSILKAVLEHRADEHINKFLLAKFGFNSSLDFDVRLYLCNGGFDFLDFGFFKRLGLTMVLYLLCHLCMLVLLFVSVLVTVFRIKGDPGSLFTVKLPPELAYHCIQMVTFGAVAVLAVRMKYFWTPYICVFASVFVFKHEAWLWLVSKVVKDYKDLDQKVKHVTSGIGIMLIAYFSQIVHTRTSDEVHNLREFYDPDTVELMHWISNSTAAESSFSGSMQLMAAVKLSTMRPITNHPHYEDKALRLKTKDLSKYYGRYSAEEVHSMLQFYSTNYIILEDSICMVPYRDGCGTPYIMDVELGLELDANGIPKGDTSALLPRFCNEVKKSAGDYGKYFKLVMANKTFRIYKVL